MFNYEVVNQSINGLTLISHPQQMDVASSSNTRGPLGLTLSKTASFESLLETSLLSQYEENQAQVPFVEKFKASNFPIDSLQIGKWYIVSTHDGHLTAKLYYSKKKIVWEVLEGPLKRKMEIQWSDITAINAVMIENQPGTLRIELAKPPLFFKETDPQPRKHTIWQPADDFTGGNATIWRTHCVSCPPGVLNRHYENLLLCHKELVNLSRKPFPSHEIPFFSSAMHFATISRLHFNHSGLQPQAHYTYRGPHPISPNPTATANLHYMNTRSRSHGSSLFSNSEVVCFDEIEDDHMHLISEYLNLNNNNNPYPNNHSQQMMDYYQTTDYEPMGGYASSVPQPLDWLPQNGGMAVEPTEIHNFSNPLFVAPDNLTANPNLLPDQHLLPDNYHTPYGTPFQNIDHQHLLPDNDLAAPVNHHHLRQNQHAFPDNLRARVNDQYHLHHNQHAFPDNPTAPVNRHLHHNQHAFPDNPMAPVNRHLHHNQHASPDNPTAPVNRNLYRNRNAYPDNPNRGNPYRK